MYAYIYGSAFYLASTYIFDIYRDRKYKRRVEMLKKEKEELDKLINDYKIMTEHIEDEVELEHRIKMEEVKRNIFLN